MGRSSRQGRGKIPTQCRIQKTGRRASSRALVATIFRVVRELSSTLRKSSRLGRDLGTFDALIIDVTAEPMTATATEDQQHKPVGETDRW